jgi:hypothetical protein
MNSHDAAQRAYVGAVLDAAADRRDAVIESMRTDVDRLRDSWAAGYAEQRQASEAPIDALREETRSFVRGLYADDGDELAAGGHRADVSALTGVPDGHSHRQQSPISAEDQWEAARLIRDMPMTDYARLRNELGVRSATDMSRLFGETR